MTASSDIFWIAGNPPPGLAVVLCPRGNGRLVDDLRQLKGDGVDVLVSLLESVEAEFLGLSEESALATQLGLTYLSYPIPDRNLPRDPASFSRFVDDLAKRLRAGKRIGVHCRGSIGRATITAACALVHLGWKPETALAAIEDARGCVVPDTEEQWEWILNYEAYQ